MKLLSPDQIAQATLSIGNVKVSQSLSRILIQSIQAGAFIALGGVLSVIVGYGFPGATAANPSLQRLLSGMVFPIGLMLVVVLGAELFTGNNAVLMPGLIKKHYGIFDVVRHWALVYFGNLIGALAFAYFLVYAVGLSSAEPYHEAAIRIASAKVSMGWWIVFLKGIGANWCVCLAVWLALSGHSLCDKLAGCFFPVMAFVALGYEHCIANMFFIPLGMMEGANVGVWQSITANFIPSTLGNIAGGAIFVGSVNALVHLKEK